MSFHHFRDNFRLETEWSDCVWDPFFGGGGSKRVKRLIFVYEIEPEWKSCSNSLVGSWAKVEPNPYFCLMSNSLIRSSSYTVTIKCMILPFCGGTLTLHLIGIELLLLHKTESSPIQKKQKQKNTRTLSLSFKSYYRILRVAYIDDY